MALARALAGRAASLPRRTRLAVLVVAVVLVTAAGRLIDVRDVAGDIKGDEATYISMAFSLAHDGDLRYDRGDYLRFVDLYGHGPNGIFLKRSYRFGFGESTPIPTSEGLSYGKALIYPAAAAPFVWIGGLGGMLIFNWLLLAGCLWAGIAFATAAGGRRGWVLALAFLAASVVPVFAAWLTSEIFNFALVFIAYFLWLYKKVRPEAGGWLTRGQTSTIVAALLLGVATFSKATNLALVGPLVLDVLLTRRVWATAAVALAFVIGMGGLFGVNALVTGEANYQGAQHETDRRSFYGPFPFDDSNRSFEELGNAMVTNDADTDRVLSSDLLAQLPANVGFFLVGRHAGFVPFYFPGAVILLVWLAGARRAPRWQWTTVLVLVGSVGALIVFFPDSWNGGGGPPGNRYFLSLYPPLLFLARPRWTGRAGLAALAGGLLFVGPMVAHPFAASAATWRNVERAPLRWLPIELTLLNDLPARLNQQRAPITFIREPTVLLYYMDGNTYSAEGDGFWIAGDATTEIIVRTEQPPRRVDIRFSSPIENHVTGSLAGKPIEAEVGQGRAAVVQLARPDGFRYHQSYAYVLHLETTQGFVPALVEPGSQDTRNLGVFVQPSFTYDDAP